ncbi:hypothetical protein Hanom_Chr09g00849321 [Helianthus anomalus]
MKLWILIYCCKFSVKLSLSNYVSPRRFHHWLGCDKTKTNNIVSSASKQLIEGVREQNKCNTTRTKLTITSQN